MNEIDKEGIMRHDWLLLLLLLLMHLRLLKHLLLLLLRRSPKLALLPGQDLLLLGPLDVRVREDVPMRFVVGIDGPLLDVRTSDQVNVVENRRWNRN
jgi:hypothetical protein